MAGSWLALLSAAALAALMIPSTAEATCKQQQSGLQQWSDPCLTSWCRRFLFARCEVHKCSARFFVGSTDVTDHCDVDNCVVENGPGIECNGVCDIDPLTGGPYCSPSCDFNNGGCSDDEVCVPDRIFCIRAPCPQPVRCIHKRVLCNQEPDTDSCGISERAFFYNASTRHCERFTYGGCERTHNRFPTRRECRQTCGGVPDVCFNSTRCPPGTMCKVNEMGNAFCEASCEYDNGGCEEICRMRQLQCLTVPCPEIVECLSRKEVCTQEADVGQCRGAFTRFYFNHLTGRCEKFSYGGCGGNENRFFTLEECQKDCGPWENPCNLVDCKPDHTCRVDEIGGAECVNSTSCRLVPCPTGFSCERNPTTNEAECVPILISVDPCKVSNCDPCHFATCRAGTICQVNSTTGEAECLLPIDKCSTFRCDPGFNCRVNPLTNEPECVIGTHACALILCLAPSICRVRPGDLVGYCGSDPCDTHTCDRGFECRFNQVLDTAECVFSVTTTNPCLSTFCAPGTACEVDPTGSPVCRPIPHPCATINCTKPDICRVNSNTQRGYCGTDPCLTTPCGRAYECLYNEKTDSADCVPTAPCLLKVCPTGQICKLNEDTGEGECAVRDIRCNVFHCPAGTVCQVKRGIRRTVECVRDNPCAHLDCGSQMCRIDIVSGTGYCGINPCSFIRCGFNTDCRYNPETDFGKCVANPCRTTLCAEGTVCRLDDDGSAQCVDPCDDVICGTLMCRVNQETKMGYCGLDPCTYTSCEAGTQCRYNMTQDVAECVVVDPCATKRCPQYTRCEVNSSTGLARCVLDIPDIRCFLLRCAAGFVCRVSNDSRHVECVPEDPCSGRNCGALMCRVNPVTQRPYCGLDPCTYTRCRLGTECQYNAELDVAVCVATPSDPCDGVTCPAGQICEATGTTGGHRCVPFSNPCDGVLCSGGDICRVNRTTRRAFCGITPCAVVLCGPNSRCVYDPRTDSGRCEQQVPNDLCSRVQCQPDRKCELNERSVPECVPICSNVLCGRPLVCRVNSTTREPYCGQYACRGLYCYRPGTTCQYDWATDLPTCRPIQPIPNLCNPTPCPSGFRCVVNSSGNPECLQLTVG